MAEFKAQDVDEIIARGAVGDADVQRLRAAYYADGIIGPYEVEALFRINDACRVQSPAWADLFIESLTDFLVNQAEPEGYINADNAHWLIDRIDQDGVVQTRTELELLVNVLDKARWSPASLVSFALRQVEHAVISGEGPLRAGLSPEPGRITEGEVALLRRILFAFGGDGSIAVTRAEAEVLFRINDACADGPANAAWTDLFVKAIANVIMGASGYKVPSREEALRRERWLDQRGDLSLGGMLGGMFRGLDAVWGGYAEQSSEERAIARLERQRIEIVTNEEITEGEVDWLAERICRDGKLTENEQKLLDFLRRESPKVHPKLQALVERLGRAA